MQITIASMIDISDSQSVFKAYLLDAGDCFAQSRARYHTVEHITMRSDTTKCAKTSFACFPDFGSFFSRACPMAFDYTILQKTFFDNFTSSV